MSNYVFKLPDVGEGIASAEIIAWHVKAGDAVKQDAPLVDVMTDKATVEIGAPVAGKIVRVKGTPGDMARVGDELVVIETEAVPAAAAKDAPPPPRKADGGTKASPPKGSSPKSEAAPAAQTVPPRVAGKVLASPAVRDRASKLAIDLADVPASGDGGRVEHADLDAFLVKSGGGTAARALTPRSTADEDVPVIGLRRQIANAMQDSKRRIPHFAYVEEIDVTEVEALRNALNQRYGDSRPKLSLLPFIVRAMVRAVADHRAVNAHYDDQAAVIHRYGAVHMGVATQTPRGLVVPVVRDAQSLGLWDVAAEIMRLSEAARAGKATREELSGSTITVSSLGRLGGLAAMPIIKPPEVAIVGVNKMAERPVVANGAVVIRKMMNLSSSFDHRVVDGYDAAEFIQAVRAALEAPAQLFID
jgi:2-oxoisovalerate dehydrogenase E2 component (dihydrolipoyl transacylase)